MVLTNNSLYANVAIRNTNSQGTSGFYLYNEDQTISSVFGMNNGYHETDALALFFWHFGAHPIRFGTNSIERLRIAGTGEAIFSAPVTIESDEIFPLTLSGTAPVIRLTDTSSSTTHLISSNNTELRISGHSHTAIYAGGSPSIYANSAGNVGIGTTSPIVKLQVQGQDAAFYSGTATQSLKVGRSLSENLEIKVEDL